MNFFYILLSTLISTVFGYLRYKYTYWEFQGIPQPKLHFLWGTLAKIQSVHLSELHQEVYQQFKGKCKMAGTYIFTRPLAIILDLDLAKYILIKDFNKFADRMQYHNEEKDPLAEHLFNLDAEKWRPLRTKLTPVFTTGKIRTMFPLVVQTATELNSTFEKMLEESPSGVLEIYDIMGRFTTDVIGTCAFGIKCNSLKDPNNIFRKMGTSIFVNKTFSIRWKMFLFTYAQYFKFLGYKRYGKDMEEFFINLVRDNIETREKSNIKRNDFIDLLIELKNTHSSDSNGGLTLEQITAQVFVFFAAGFETSSTDLSCCIFELAKNPSVQDKLRAEIEQVLEEHNNELTYEAMSDMHYLDQTMTETLRMYPALAALKRIATVDYDVPGTKYRIEKGTTVYIPIKEIHYDPDIYDSPTEFRPERFAPTELQKRHPQAFLGFGDGPRNCIGLRFARMQVRIGLIYLLKSFRFSLPEHLPQEVQICPYSAVLIPDKGVRVQVEHL